jgi:hypothetical protein
MPKRKPDEIPDAQERIARALALIAVKDIADREDAARRLLGMGYDSPTIGGLLGVGPNFANVAKGRKPKRKSND